MENRKERRLFCRAVSGMFVCLFAVSLNLSAQSSSSKNKDKVYNRVDNMPYYLYEPITEENCGKDVNAIFEFISDNIRYPEDAWEAKKQGTVVCAFIVEKDGSFTNIHVDHSLYPSLDKEAIRVVGSFPKWHPGILNGNVVRTSYTLPIIFRRRAVSKKE